jgi:hypothetical protein
VRTFRGPFGGREDAYGAATSRAEAQVLRLSAIYAALDSSPLTLWAKVEDPKVVGPETYGA